MKHQHLTGPVEMCQETSEKSLSGQLPLKTTPISYQTCVSLGYKQTLKWTWFSKADPLIYRGKVKWEKTTAKEEQNQHVSNTKLRIWFWQRTRQGKVKFESQTLKYISAFTLILWNFTTCSSADEKLLHETQVRHTWLTPSQLNTATQYFVSSNLVLFLLT